MKSLIDAINNLAKSIFSLSSSMSSKVDLPTIQKELVSPSKTTKYPYSDYQKNIDFSYNTYGSLTLDEREALYKVYTVIFNKEINEPIHDKTLANLLKDLKRDWPSLHSAIDSLIKTKNIKNTKKYSNRHYHLG